MGELIQFNKNRPHIAGEAKCLACRATWTAVGEAGTRDMYCPFCDCPRGVWVNPVCAPMNTKFFVCNCGADMFRITEKGILCVSCGEMYKRIDFSIEASDDDSTEPRR